jgi:hypothetical protein
MNPAVGVIDPVARAFYRDVMIRLEERGIPFLVGGAYAFERYTGIARHTRTSISSSIPATWSRRSTR